jgi:molecular chaperone IbpA
MALAGLDDNDIEVEVQENTLTIMHESSEKKEEGKLYQGIAQRSFRRQFKLADDIEVVGASLKNGLLCINLTRFIPEEKKPKKIKIES